MVTTLDFTGDGNGQPPNSFNAMAQPACFYKRLKVADIIADDATMTTNGYIAIGDIIQAVDVPIGFVVTHCIVQIVTPTTNACNIEVGLAGGAEGIASFDIDGTAETFGQTIETDAWAGGIHTFEAADTIDVEFITANATDGDLKLWVLGWMLNLSEV